MPTQTNLRHSEAQHARWKAFASSLGLPLATWIKRVLDGKSGFNPKPENKKS